MSLGIGLNGRGTDIGYDVSIFCVEMLMGVEIVRKYNLASRSVMTRRLTSVEGERDIGTLSPLVVVEGPVFVVGWLTRRTASSHRLHNCDFWNNLNTPFRPLHEPSLPPHDREAVLSKCSFWQWFSQDVRHLIVRRRSIYDDFLTLNVLTEMVECFVDMFGAWSHFR